MAYALRFDGVNDYCQFSNLINIDFGLNAYTFEAKLILNATPTNLGGLLGRNGTTSGFFITPTLTLAMYVTNTLRYQTAANFFLQDGNMHTYRLEHDSGGAWRAYRDGVLFGSGTFSSSTTATNQGWIGQGNNSANTFCSMDLEHLEVTGVTNAARWDANLAGGTGSTLPTAGGTNDATLINFPTDNSQWVFYSTGGAYTLTADGGTYSYSGGSVSLRLNRSLQAAGSSYSYAGGVATLTYTPAGVSYTLNADGGLFSYSGGNAALRFNRKLQAAGGVYSYSGSNAGLSRGYKVSASGGVYGYSGGAATLDYVPATGYTLTALGASFGYSGGDATFTYSQTYPQAVASDFTVTGRLSDSANYSAIMYQSTTYSGRLN